MFTGIIEELGTVVSLRREANVARLALKASSVREDLRVGDSLATNGVCLTVERILPAQLELTMMPETLNRTTLGDLKPGDRVNLERALRLDGRLGGHLLAGHVDGVSSVAAITGIGEERVLTFALPAALARFIAPKGSIAVDGISLTVTAVGDVTFAVSLIRHTLGATTLALRGVGDRVNLEVDLIARYLDRLLGVRDTGEAPAGLSLERLRALGF
jgi:riboflavin synthase